MHQLGAPRWLHTHAPVEVTSKNPRHGALIAFKSFLHSQLIPLQKFNHSQSRRANKINMHTSITLIFNVQITNYIIQRARNASEIGMRIKYSKVGSNASRSTGTSVYCQTLTLSDQMEPFTIGSSNHRKYERK